MKCIIVATVLCVLAAAYAAPTKEQIEAVKKAHEHCQSQEATRIDDDVFEKLKNGEKVQNPKLSKHTLCMNVQTGLQTESGDINVDKLRKAVSEASSDQSVINAIVEKCGTKTGDTAEDAAVNLFKCLRSHSAGQHGHGHH
ncbi:B1 protein-like [Diabrotica undecimpunctata]|uniref:B1 protein-like n=1 Tax=Diabrotica undecimpunctata TaxID=50387 RepID=UPI003B63F9DD